MADGTQEAEGAGMDTDSIFCTLVYITVGAAWPGKHGEMASSVVVKLLSKAISDQIRSTDGSVMTVRCRFGPDERQREPHRAFCCEQYFSLKGSAWKLHHLQLHLSALISAPLDANKNKLQ